MTEQPARGMTMASRGQAAHHPDPKPADPLAVKLERLADQLMKESYKASTRNGDEQAVLQDVAYRIRYALDTA